MDWSPHYPAFINAKTTGTTDTTTASTAPPPLLTATAPHPTIADIGCGFGGLLLALSPLFPNDLILGLELRNQVLAYVHSRIAALRSQNPLLPPAPPATTEHHPSSSSNGTPSNPTPTPSTTTTTTSTPTTHYQNISALRTNTMKFLPQLLPPSALTHLFLCFPDPHFKQRKHKARIVSSQLNAEYAYFVRPGGKVYTITDVEELHLWIVRHFEGEDTAGEVRELWERVRGEELEGDVCVRVMREETEEGKKVTRNGGRKFVGVWRRRENPPWPEE